MPSGGSPVERGATPFPSAYAASTRQLPVSLAVATRRAERGDRAKPTLSVGDGRRTGLCNRAESVRVSARAPPPPPHPTPPPPPPPPPTAPSPCRGPPRPPPLRSHNAPPARRPTHPSPHDPAITHALTFALPVRSSSARGTLSHALARAFLRWLCTTRRQSVRSNLNCLPTTSSPLPRCAPSRFHRAAPRGERPGTAGRRETGAPSSKRSGARHDSERRSPISAAVARRCCPPVRRISSAFCCHALRGPVRRNAPTIVGTPRRTSGKPNCAIVAR